MVHQREICFSGQVECSFPLQKRIDDFYIVQRGAYNVRDKASSLAANKTLPKTLDQISQATGLEPILSKPDGTSDYVFIVFVDQEEVEKDKEMYLRARILRKSFVSKAKESTLRRNLFNHFLKSEIPCLAFGKTYPSYAIKDTHIWIKTGLGVKQLQRCIAEELFNSLGWMKAKK